MIAVQLIYSIVTRGIKNSMPYLLMLMAYSTLTFLAFRGNKIAAWIVIISVLVSGIGTFLIGIFLVAVNQVAMKSIFVLLGLYYIYGGVTLLYRCDSTRN
jgi:ribose/xylose/arabinose/galactoside ABC-type transport system permease subunit